MATSLARPLCMRHVAVTLLSLATPVSIATCNGALAMQGGVAGQPGDLHVGLSFSRDGSSFSALWQ